MRRLWLHHIEPDGSCVHIRQAVNMVKGKPYIGPPKSAASVRDVPVPPNVRPCAVFLREQAGKFVWESPIAGQPVNSSHFRDKYRNALFKVPGVRMLTPHSCRHTYVSQLQALGVDMETIQSIIYTSRRKCGKPSNLHSGIVLVQMAS